MIDHGVEMMSEDFVSRSSCICEDSAITDGFSHQNQVELSKAKVSSSTVVDSEAKQVGKTRNSILTHP